MDALDALLEAYDIPTEATTDDELAAVAAANSEMDLTRFASVSSAKISYATEYGQSITKLVVVDTALTDADLAPLIDLLPALKEVDLSQSAKLTDVTLIALAQTSPGITKLTLNACTGFTDAGIMVAALTLNSLTDLSLTACTKLTDQALEALSQAPCIASLTSLSLAYSTSYTSDTLEALLSETAALESLNLALVACVRNESLKVVADRAPRLRDLNIASCLLIDDDGIAELCGGDDDDAEGIGPTLTTLNCASLPLVTDFGLSLLADYFPALRDLNLQLCEGITQLGAENLYNSAPHIAKLTF
ncbi:uncharacterized protein AMSG_04099, partial [Thecamonas trahens ATCC 50062]